MKKPKEFWISELPKDYGNQVYCFKDPAIGYIHVREVKPINWNKIWKEFNKVSHIALNSLEEHKIIEQLVEKHLKGE